MKCENCKWFNKITRNDIPTKELGTCHRYPPRYNNIKDVEYLHIALGGFPTVNKDSYCGEFRSVVPEINEDSIGLLNLPSWVHNRLWDEGITTVGDLIKYDKRQLRKIYRFGGCSVRWVERQLSKHNLYLRGNNKEAEEKAEAAIREALGIN